MDNKALLNLIDRSKNTIFSTLTHAKTNKIDHQSIVGCLKSLIASAADEHFLKVTDEIVYEYKLTDEAKNVVANGSYEFNILKLVPKEGINMENLSKISKVPTKIGFSKAMQKKWIKMDKTTKLITKLVEIEDITDELPEMLKNLKTLDPKTRNELRKRKLFNEISITSFNVSQGPKFNEIKKTVLEEKATDLTPEMLATGSWKNTCFKEYNFDAKGVMPESGNLHPLLKVRSVYRNILLEMGFNEMKTNNFVESSFWNFDCLFQPQMHPARDAHDTFFISDPNLADATKFPAKLLEDVKNTHENGGNTGSIGYRYDWKLSEAKKNILRTHTTAVTCRTLYELGKRPGGFKPAKYFSIDRVFRNETLDATHLAEFHQVEGFIVDYDLTLANLIGVLDAFFRKLGINKLRFKPAYNPYTEPSMEVFSYHEGLKKWVEIGNSGMFRPEMLDPLGIPKGCSAIAWGLSLERPAMIKYKLNNIRDLCGHKIDLNMCKTNPVCRMDFV